MNKISEKEAWILAIRPRTLPAAIGPVILGSAAAFSIDAFHLLSAVSALLAALCLQIAVNLANDYFDARAGHDTEKRLGPLRVTHSGLIAAPRVFAAMLFFLALAFASGFYLLLRGGLPAIIIAILSLTGVLAYSAGPLPMTEKGYGEFAAFLFFGPIAVCGTSWVMALEFSSVSLIASLPMGMLIAAILAVNNIRDLEHDNMTGKRTLAVRIGLNPTRYLFSLLIAGAYIFPLILYIKGERYLLLSLISLPKAIVIIQGIWQMEGRLLNELLADTAKLSLFFALLYSLGLIMGKLF